MSTPYISRQPHDLIRAADWNEIQVQTRAEIQGHGHTGGDDGVQLGADALADGAVTASKLDSNAVTEDSIDNHAVSENKIRDDAVSEDKIRDGAVTWHKIADGVVAGSKLSNEAVSENKILRGAVTEDKIADDAVTEYKIRRGAVTGEKLADDAVTHRKIADDAVTGEKIADDAVTHRKIAHSAVNEDKIDFRAVTESRLANGAVSENKLADRAVTTVKLADGAVTEAKLADGAVTTAHIMDGSITAEKLAPGVGGGGPLPEPLAVDITGSTVRTVPLTPVFDCFSLTIPLRGGRIMPTSHDVINVAGPLTELVDSFVGLVPDGTSMWEPYGQSLTRAVCTVIDNVPRHLMQELGEVQAAHQAVAVHLPAYMQQLEVLNGKAGGNVIIPALELVQLIESCPVGVVRSFAYMFTSLLESLFDDMGPDSLLDAIQSHPTIGGLSDALANSYHRLCAGRMSPIEGATVLRISQPAGSTGGGLILCEAEAMVTVNPLSPAFCAIGIGTETIPPPPGQVTWVNLEGPTQSIYVRRSIVYLPAMTRSLRLWAVGVPGGHEPLHARLDCRHMLLEPYGIPTVVDAANTMDWDDA